MKTPTLLILSSLLVTPSLATANDVRRNDTGGFSIYGEDGEYLGSVVPNDTGGYDVRAVDGRKVHSVDSTGDVETDLEVLNVLVVRL